MGSVNRVILEGRIVKDAVLKYTGQGAAICNFSVAYNRSVKKNGQYIDVTYYFDAAVYGKYAESLSSYLLKGKKIVVEGALVQDRWKDGAGNTRTAVKINCDNVSIASPAKSGGNDSPKKEQPAGETEPGFDDDGIPF